nr:class E sortase [uncultured Bifidobacterium sp.]
MGVIGELLLTMAVVCALYVVWQLWWTGVESGRAQEQTRQSASWSAPSSSAGTTVAKAQKGDPPVQPASATTDELIAEVYIPRFGSSWSRTIVQGTGLEQLARHGLGHYTTSQMPGQVGNFAIAGHRSGYGQPLGDIDKLRSGDSIIIRTKDYWYVYTYTSHEIVLPTEVRVISSNPQNPAAKATKRLITMTTCTPKYVYAHAPYRWIAYGELKYWARVSDGIPKELASTDSSGKVSFVSSSAGSSVLYSMPSLDRLVAVALVLYAVLAASAAVAWRWPALRSARDGRSPRGTGPYGWLLRMQPGVLPIRILLVALLVVAGVAALFEWAFPWAASSIPYLQSMSNYVTV